MCRGLEDTLFAFYIRAAHHRADAFRDVLNFRFDFFFGVLVSFRIPDLDAADDPDDRDIAVQSGKIAQVLGNDDPTLLVRIDVGGFASKVTRPRAWAAGCRW